MKHIYTLLSFLLLWNYTSAQNTVLLEELDSFKLKKDYSKLLPAEFGKHIDVNLYLKMAIHSFRRGHLTSYDGLSWSSSIFSIYDLYSAMDAAPNKQEEVVDYTIALDALKKLSFSNKPLLDSVYNFTKPLICEAISKMTYEETEALMDLFYSAIVYTKDLDLKKEEAEVKRLDYGYVQNRGKLKAFIYRRLKDKDFSKEECIKWLQRFISDFSACVVYPTKKEEHYYLTSRICPGYYYADKFGEEGDSEGAQIMYKGPKGFELVTDEFGLVNNNGFFNEDSVSWAFHLQQGGKKEFLFFHLTNPDSAKILQKITAPSPLSHFSGEYNIKMAYYESNEIDFFVYGKPDAKGNRAYIRYALDIDSVEIWQVQASKHYLFIPYLNGEREIFYKLEIKDKDKFSYKTLKLPTTVSRVFYDEQENMKVQDTSYAVLSHEHTSFELLMATKDSVWLSPLPKDLYLEQIQRWKQYFIYTIALDSSTNRRYPNYRYGVLSLKGRSLLKPIFTKAAYWPEMNFLLLEQFKNGIGYFAIFDKNLNKRSDFIYQFVDQANRPTDVNNLWTGYDVGGGIDSVVILYNNRYDENKQLKASKATMFGYDGKVLIPEKWPYIQCISFEPQTTPSLYAVYEQATYSNNTINPAGKCAIFDRKGRQLTDFIYENAQPVYGDNFFYASKNGEEVKIGVDGKEMK